MSSGALSLFMDLLVMGGLVTTIYFALKLSKSLNSFRNHRKEFEGLIGELNKNIENAYEALAALKQESGRTTGNMDHQLEEAKALADELKLMMQSGNNLADRLENAAGNAGKALQSSARPQPDFSGLEDEDIFDDEGGFEDEAPSFFIQDREFDEPAAPGGADLQSQAEKELYEALQRSKKKRSA